MQPSRMHLCLPALSLGARSQHAGGTFTHNNVLMIVFSLAQLSVQLPFKSVQQWPVRLRPLWTSALDDAPRVLSDMQCNQMCGYDWHLK